MRIFISGATGYIGGQIAFAAVNQGDEVSGGVRRLTKIGPNITPIVTGDLAEGQFTLPEVDVVVHAAGLGHRRGVARDVWQRQNVAAAVKLAEAAKAAGATRFILISTAYVHGRVSSEPVTDSSPVAPPDDYAQSKLDAEAAVRAAFGPGVSVVRPVAVIGPGCPGNVPLLLKALRHHVTLPLNAIDNRRSFIPVADLATLVLAVAAADTPPETVLAAHPESISTPGLVHALAEGLRAYPLLIGISPPVLRLAARLFARTEMVQSLTGDFRAEPRAALALGWRPAQTLVESLADTARYYATTHKTA
jgi:UDP-glucose 4-epimerase